MSQSIAELFIKEAIKTENLDLSKLIERLSEEKTLRLLHAAMGMVTEAGEFMDALKKHIIYGKPLDEINLKEELGDLNWYEAIAHNTLNSSFEEVMIINIQKLRKRYVEKFSESEALSRDLNVERNELEKKIDLASGFGMGVKKLTEVVKVEIEDKSIVVHWLKDDLSDVICNNLREGEKYTLDLNILNCYKCREILAQELLNAKEDYGLN